MYWDILVCIVEWLTKVYTTEMLLQAFLGANDKWWYLLSSFNIEFKDSSFLLVIILNMLPIEYCVIPNMHLFISIFPINDYCMLNGCDFNFFISHLTQKQMITKEWFYRQFLYSIEDFYCRQFMRSLLNTMCNWHDWLGGENIIYFYFAEECYYFELNNFLPTADNIVGNQSLMCINPS